jgi:hypothetical protein
MLPDRFPEDAWRLFQRVFCFKVALFGLLHHLSPDPIEWIGAAVPLAGLGLAIPPTTAPIGNALLLAYRLAHSVAAFPFTLNHAFFEVWLLLFLVLFPPGPRDAAGQVDGLAPGLARLATLAMWFYAGVQKVGHGRYLDGEMMTVDGLFEGGRMVHVFTPVVSGLERLAGLPVTRLPLMWPESVDAAPLELTWVARACVLGASWVVLLGEFILPPMALAMRTRTPAILLLVLLQFAVAVSSREFSFGVTSTAGLLLWLPERAHLSYSLLAVLVVTAFVLVVGGF